MINSIKSGKNYFFFFKGIPLFLLFIYLFIYSWLCWVFASVQGPSPVAASGGHSPPRCAGPSPSRSTGSRRAGPAAVAHGPSRSAARGIPPDQGPNPCPLHRQADPQPLRHQGSPAFLSFLAFVLTLLLCSGEVERKGDLVREQLYLPSPTYFNL